MKKKHILSAAGCMGKKILIILLLFKKNLNLQM
jgi:hypothetical protein